MISGFFFQRNKDQSNNFYRQNLCPLRGHNYKFFIHQLPMFLVKHKDKNPWRTKKAKP